jgi:hypothetical protein
MSKLKGASGWLASGLLAFLAPFLCCIAPILALVFGASAAASASTFTNRYRWLFFGLAAVSFGYAGWKLIYKKRQKTGLSNLQSLLTCPRCGHQKIETMPTNACQFFYECENCNALLKPKPGDCCVFCSYGTVKCPPVQAGDKNCC